MRPVNFRYDEFLELDQAVTISDEEHTVPTFSPFYVALREIPKVGTLSVVSGTAGIVATPTQDCWSDQGNASTPHGSGIFNAAGRDDAGLGSWIYRTFMQWDLSSLPSTAVSAKIRVYRISGQGAPTFSFHRVEASWSESTLTHTSQPSFDPVADGQFTIVADQMGWYEADITDLYNAWQDATYDNYGVVLRTEEVDTNTVSNWASINNASPAIWPQLVVSGGGTAMTILAYNVTPSAGEVAVHFGTGRMRFAPADAGILTRTTYDGLGSPIDASDWYVDPPTNANDPGREGQYAFDGTYSYDCIADNTWMRTAHSTW